MKAKQKEKGITCTAITLIRVPGVSPHEAWQSCVLTIEDGVVTDMAVSEGNLKKIAIETLKISFVREFIDNERTH